jgi:aspartate/methionine/tyrosine aminotransferase
MRFAPFALEELFEKYEHQRGITVLGASDASSPTLAELFEICGESPSFLDVRLSYGHVKGDHAFRAALASSYADAQLSADHILVTLGGSEAIFIAVQALAAPGDLVLACEPAYQPLQSVARAVGATVEHYTYDLTPQGFRPDVGKLLARLNQQPTPRLLILNTPHNPTGFMFEEDDLRALLRAARSKGIAVLVDEVFLGVAFDTPVPKSAIELDPSAIVIGSLSKVYGLSGLRLGWIAASPEILDRCRSIRHYTSIAPPILVQDLGAMAIRHRGKLLARTQSIAESNLRHVVAWLQPRSDFFDWLIPQAGLVILLRLKLDVETDKFVADLARDTGVFVVPCTVGFGMERGFLRIGIGTDPATLRSGLDRIGVYLDGRRLLRVTDWRA